MVGGKRKSASTVSDEEPSTKLKKTRQGSKMTSKEQRLAMFKRPKPIIPLDDWPLGVLERLVNFLDVVSLAQLASTNHFFQQLVAGRYLLNIHFPFDQAFLDELSAVSVIEKKPLLRMTCSKVIAIFPKPKAFQHQVPNGLLPLINYQLSMLDLSRLRDLTLGAAHQACRGIPCNCKRCKSDIAAARHFDLLLWTQLSDQQGLLKQLTSLQVLIDDLDPYFLEELPNLHTLTLVIATSAALPKLEKIVAIAKVSELSVMAMCVVGRKPSARLLSNAYVKRLHVRGPCDLQFHVRMSGLQHLTVKPLDEGTEYGQDFAGGMPCKFAALARALHGVGQCSVDVRAILQGHCPNIQTFCGINLREASGKIKSKQQVRKILHKDYVARGGAMELGLWSKRYWRGRAVVMAQGRRRRLFDNIFNVCAMM